jgi:hypothetical protein
MYKTGHRDFPSIEKYTSLIESHGVNSAQAENYLSKFRDDINFSKQAEAIKNLYQTKNGANNDKE